MDDMSNLEAQPVEQECEGHPAESEIQILTPRDVPLGGPRAMRVRRTLPQRERSLIGGWCFADHYGPDDVGSGPGMHVPPHPHTGLQTVSWLFTGEIEHRDSIGSHAMVRPGELNLMTAGSGIAHSEVSTPNTKVLHGMQLWVALPDAARDTAPAFVHYRPEPVTTDGVTLSVFLGSLAGETSPVSTFTELLGAEVILDPGAEIALDVDRSHEHGVIVDQGSVVLRGTTVGWAEFGLSSTGFRKTDFAQSGIRTGSTATSRRETVGRAGHHVVELHGPYTRRDRRVSTQVAGRACLRIRRQRPGPAFRRRAGIRRSGAPGTRVAEQYVAAPRLVVALAATGRERRFDQACSMSW